MAFSSVKNPEVTASFLAVLKRRGCRASVLFCFFILLLVIGFINMNTQFRSVMNADVQTHEAEKHTIQHHLHECLCNVSVILSGTQNRAPNGTLIPLQEDNKLIQNIYRKQSGSESGSRIKVEQKVGVWPNINIDPAQITLKPNFSSIINATEHITTVDGQYVLENPELCSSVKELTFIVIVHSAPAHFPRRLAIRNSWANDAFYRHLGTTRVLFLLGLTGDETHDKSIKQEFNHFGDILQGDFMDSYHNLTLKGVMAFKWLTERCRNAQFVLKVDDDISVNMFKVLTEIYQQYKNKPMQITCNHIEPQSMPILRQNDSKWFVNDNHFRGMDSYPTDYCSGFFVIFTNDMIPLLYESSKKTPFFWIDDVYLYGLVPGNVPKITYVGLTGDWYQLDGHVALRCYKNTTAVCPFLVVGAGANGEMQEMWPQMVKRYSMSLDE